MTACNTTQSMRPGRSRLRIGLVATQCGKVALIHSRRASPWSTTQQQEHLNTAFLVPHLLSGRSGVLTTIQRSDAFPYSSFCRSSANLRPHPAFPEPPRQTVRHTFQRCFGAVSALHASNPLFLLGLSRQSSIRNHRSPFVGFSGCFCGSWKPWISIADRRLHVSYLLTSVSRPVASEVLACVVHALAALELWDTRVTTLSLVIERLIGRLAPLVICALCLETVAGCLRKSCRVGAVYDSRATVLCKTE